MNKGYSVYKAACIYGIPESTLRDRTLGIQPVYDFLPTPGPGITLSREEKRMLIDHIEYMNSVGYGYSRQEFLNLATNFAISLKEKSPEDPSSTQAWFDSLKKIWPYLTLAKPQKLSVVWTKSASKQIINKYYAELDAFMAEHNLLNRPENIFDVDETGITIEHSPAKVVCAKELAPQSVTSSRGKNLTVIACGSASCTRLPPFYIFPGKCWNEDLMKDTSLGSAGCMTESGWSNSDVFLEYMETLIKRYILLIGDTKLELFDGHKSHINLTQAEWSRKNKVVFFVLPPHTSHITQPLDVGCFALLKSTYNRECQSFIRQCPGQQITQYDVGAITSQAYNKAITTDHLAASFRKTGIFPFNKDSKLAPSIVYTQQEIPEEETTSTSFLESCKIIKAEANPKKRITNPSVFANLCVSGATFKKPEIVPGSHSKWL